MANAKIYPAIMYNGAPLEIKQAFACGVFVLPDGRIIADMSRNSKLAGNGIGLLLGSRMNFNNTQPIPGAFQLDYHYLGGINRAVVIGRVYRGKGDNEDSVAIIPKNGKWYYAGPSAFFFALLQNAYYWSNVMFALHYIGNGVFRGGNEFFQNYVYGYDNGLVFDTIVCQTLGNAFWHSFQTQGKIPERPATENPKGKGNFNGATYGVYWFWNKHNTSQFNTINANGLENYYPTL